jgi:hypothetical protein
MSVYFLPCQTDILGSSMLVECCFVSVILNFKFLHFLLKFYSIVTGVVLFLFYIRRKCSWYSDWLQGGRPRGRSSSLGRVKNFLFSMSSRLALGSTQPPTQWVLGALSLGVKCPGREEDKDLYFHSPIHLHGVVLN